MIFPGTLLNVLDNSGAKKVFCIRILNTKNKYGSIGDIIKVSIKKCLFNSKVKKGMVFNALIVNTKYSNKRKNGFNISFGINAVIILDSKLEILGTRIFGVIPKEFKNSDFKRIVSLSKYVL